MYHLRPAVSTNISTKNNLILYYILTLSLLAFHHIRTNTKHWGNSKRIVVNTRDDRDTLRNKLNQVKHWYYHDKPNHDINTHFTTHAQDVLRLIADITDKKMTLGQSLFGLLRMLTYGLENVIAIPIQEFQILSY